jgi:hypothetical protein
VKIYVYPAGLDGCGYYRLIWPALALKKLGHDITLVLPQDRNNPKTSIQGKLAGDKLVDIDVPADADVMVMQRVTHKYLHQGIEIIRKKGVAVVIDMDDDLGRVHPSNPAFGWLKPGNTGEHTWDNGLHACETATMVTTSTPQLQGVYAKKTPGRVIRNHIPRQVLGIPHRSQDSDLFGWTGALHSHPNDPIVLGSSVQRLVREGFHFGLVGNPEGVPKAFGIEGLDWATGILPIEQWHEGLAHLHVGLAPLADTLFNASKSWLKPLELAAVGVPPVMSPRREYRDIHKRGVGVMADGPKDWYRHVKRLMTDDAYWTEVAERSKAAVIDLTIEANAWRWLEVWSEAAEIERSRTPVSAQA